MRLIVVFAALWVLVGCSVPALLQKEKPCPGQNEQDQFMSALDQFIKNRQLTALEKFQQRYPSSPLSAHARSLVQYGQLHNQDLGGSQSSNQQPDSELETLRNENQLLNEKIEQLKKLLIELEQRPR